MTRDTFSGAAARETRGIVTPTMVAAETLAPPIIIVRRSIWVIVNPSFRELATKVKTVVPIGQTLS